MAKQLRVETGSDNEEAPIYGLVLELILSHVPLIDLVSASRVSRAWNHAVSSTLRHVTPTKPWLLVHSQTTRPPYAATAHAYDPRSGDWLQIRRHAPPLHGSNLRSSHSSLLYSLTPTSLDLSTDALRLGWRSTAVPPRVFRYDPVVAVVGGDRVVVCGGACDFGDEPIPVEVYDLSTGAWSACDAELPGELVDSPASTWLSTAVRGGEMFVAERSSGMAYAFDAVAMTWRGGFDLGRGSGDGRRVFSTAVEFVGDGGLVAAGLVGSPESVETVIMRKFSGDSLEVMEILGEMPGPIVARLKGESGFVSSISLVTEGNFVFLMNPSDPREIIQCDIAGGVCRWTAIRNAAVSDGDWTARRLSLGCADVAVDYLRRALAAESFTIAPKV